jgi:hypothetical protein
MTPFFLLYAVLISAGLHPLIAGLLTILVAFFIIGALIIAIDIFIEGIERWWSYLWHRQK